MTTTTSSAPRFEVVRVTAIHNDYDAIAGWSFRRLAVTQTAAWAHVLAAREDFDHDLYAEVREIGTGRRVYREWPQTAAAFGFDDEIPF